MRGIWQEEHFGKLTGLGLDPGAGLASHLRLKAYLRGTGLASHLRLKNNENSIRYEYYLSSSVLWRSCSLKIVVTGGAGFIGSHLCARLLEDGHSVLCVDNLLTGSEQNIDSLRVNPCFTFLQHDVTHPFNFEAEAIFHLASPASPVGYMEHPIETILVNSQASYQMLEQARKQKALFLFASTSEINVDPIIHPHPAYYCGYVNSI